MGLRKSKHLRLPEQERLDRSEALCSFWNYQASCHFSEDKLLPNLHDMINQTESSPPVSQCLVMSVVCLDVAYKSTNVGASDLTRQLHSDSANEMIKCMHGEVP